eukprot:CAMPEP_0113315308 /NCGR_PEP_ID=MMETSP0010_2-20120614/11030_1 /TAXON_ID=216773 ORGANISM="Corethron hystrix, Strain 308" /NCGR_SAMPLE_ID=MMETSP0010_2 /ASSEMBLY_ACC=CAM_ASM_000155 /LENGTH=344 /DNA_ID=CAMNT_0000171787 /DNA_START=921 /DNA_END=1955 /DNA_ORIENTATION=- /assembly_acc=CAM_ASM_000155
MDNANDDAVDEELKSHNEQLDPSGTNNESMEVGQIEQATPENDKGPLVGGHDPGADRTSSIGEPIATAMRRWCRNNKLLLMVRSVLFQPGFICMGLGFITACIVPLREALFSPGGQLRFVGSVVEALGDAGPILINFMAAASLADLGNERKSGEGNGGKDDDEGERMELVSRRELVDNDDISMMHAAHDKREATAIVSEIERSESRPPPVSVCDRLLAVASCMRSIFRDSPSQRIHIWHCSTRLLVTPFLTLVVLLVVDCGIAMSPIAKAVLLVNSSFPGAMVMIVILKGEGLDNVASIVSQSYLPCYLLSIFSCTFWTAVGLWMFGSNDDGINRSNYICRWGG